MLLKLKSSIENARMQAFSMREFRVSSAKPPGIGFLKFGHFSQIHAIFLKNMHCKMLNFRQFLLNFFKSPQQNSTKNCRKNFWKNYKKNCEKNCRKTNKNLLENYGENFVKNYRKNFRIYCWKNCKRKKEGKIGIARKITR